MALVIISMTPATFGRRWCSASTCDSQGQLQGSRTSAKNLLFEVSRTERAKQCHNRVRTMTGKSVPKAQAQLSAAGPGSVTTERGYHNSMTSDRSEHRLPGRTSPKTRNSTRRFRNRRKIRMSRCSMFHPSVRCCFLDFLSKCTSRFTLQTKCYRSYISVSNVLPCSQGYCGKLDCTSRTLQRARSFHRAASWQRPFGASCTR